MTPSQLAKSNTERGHQTAFFAFCAVAHLHGFDAAEQWDAEGDRYLGELAVLVGMNLPKVPALKWIHAIHNQGHGDVIRGAQAKAEGLRAGIADIFLPYPVGIWHGLYMEMKRPEHKPKRNGTVKGHLSQKQIEFRDYALMTGYGWGVCYGWRDAVEMVRGYINWR